MDTNNPTAGGRFDKKSLLVRTVRVLVILFAIVAIVGCRNRISEEARAHVGLNELSAISALRVIVRTADTYRDSYHHYPRSLAQMAPPVSGTGDEEAADLIDARLASGKKDGYQFDYSLKGAQGLEGFEVHADPLSSSTGVRHFYVNETGIIRWDNTLATNQSQPVE